MRRELPTVASDAAVEVEAAADAGGPGGGRERESVSSGRLVATLSIAGAVAGLIIVLVFAWANPRIQAYRAKVLREAVQEVLHEPTRTQRYYVTAEGLSDAAPPGADTIEAEKIFQGFDADGRSVGYAVTGAEPGFQDIINLIFGYEPATGKLLAMKVLESKETPGLGDRIMKDQAFISGFEGAEAPIKGVKKGAGTGDPHQVDMITGATISSRAVIKIINDRVEALDPVLERAASDSTPAESGDGTGADGGGL